MSLKNTGKNRETVKCAGIVSSHSLGEVMGELEVLRGRCDGRAVIKEFAEGWMHEHNGGPSGSVGSMIKKGGVVLGLRVSPSHITR